MIERKKPLQRKTPLKRSTKPIKRSSIKQKTYEEAKAAAQAKATKPRKPIAKKSARPIAKLKAEADKWFSLYIRYRDGRYTHARGWETECMTCSKWLPFKKMQAGHFVSRTINELRFDEVNVNGQCYFCNVAKSGQLHFYYQALNTKYGDGAAESLLSRRHLTHKLTRQELEQIIMDAKTCIDHYIKFEEGGMLPDAKKPLNTAITNEDDPANKKYRRRKIFIVQK
jgi:hypothetical protein